MVSSRSFIWCLIGQRYKDKSTSYDKHKFENSKAMKYVGFTGFITHLQSNFKSKWGHIISYDNY